MIRFKSVFAAAIYLLLASLGIFIWNISVLYSDLSTFFSSHEISPSHEIVTKQSTNALNPVVSLNNILQSQVADSIKRGQYELIHETMARIKRDVIVTGAIIGTRGLEEALFQIEGMPDKPFKINTQLMDGFIITEISNRNVLLKNQSGNETLTLEVKGS